MTAKVVTNVKSEVMNVTGAQRAFYRIYILPQHIEKREGEVKAELQKELARHKKFVKDNNLLKELDKYIAAQQEKQSLYDKWQQAKADFAVLKGAKNIEDFQAIADKQKEMHSAENAFKAYQEYFKETFH